MPPEDFTMTMQDDPAMKEIIDDFCKETNSLFVPLQKTLENLEAAPTNTKELERFGQMIDRIMGAAKSIGATEIATFCELGKTIGYKASQTKDVPLLNVVVAILFDTIDLLSKMIAKLQTGNATPLRGLNTDAFVTRLRWLSDKFKNIDRASCIVEDPDSKKNLSQASIDELMNSLGL